MVLCLVTPSWLASDECFSEFRAAWYVGKRIVPLFVLPPSEPLGEIETKRLGNLQGEDQGLSPLPSLAPDGSLDPDRDGEVASLLEAGLRAAGAISRVGLDPEACDIDKKLRPTPFPDITGR